MRLPFPGSLVQVNAAIFRCLALGTVSALRPLSLPRSGFLAAQNSGDVLLRYAENLLARILKVLLREAGYSPVLLARVTQKTGMATVRYTRRNALSWFLSCFNPALPAGPSSFTR